MKTTYICSECNSDNVQLKAWVNPNNNDQFVERVDEYELGWCCDCKNHVDVITTKLEDDAKIVGYQVVGNENSRERGHIHPKMKASFCIYNLNQANEMLSKKYNYYGYWRLQTIWEGDIEEPTFMFEGDCR